MKNRQAFLTFAPCLALLCLLWLCWDFVEDLLSHAPTILYWLAALTLLPLVFHLASWSSSRWQKPQHPYCVVMPLGLFLVVLSFSFSSIGEKVAMRIPFLCKVSTWLVIKPDRPGSSGSEAYFGFSANGRGNASSYEFSLVTVSYKGSSRKDDLYVLLPRWNGFYINSYTAYFPVTLEKVAEYVQRNDDFPERDAKAIADELWAVLHDLAERRNMPPFVYRGWQQPGERIVYWVPVNNSFLATVVLCLPVLLVISWLLAARYSRLIKEPHDVRPSKREID